MEVDGEAPQTPATSCRGARRERDAGEEETQAGGKSETLLVVDFPRNVQEREGAISRVDLGSGRGKW